MPGSIKSLKRRPTAKSAAKRIGRMFKRTNSDDPEATSPADSGFSKDSFESSRVSTSSRFSTSSRMTTKENVEQTRPSVSRYDTAPPKEHEVVPPHPFFSSNSEPLLEHGKPVAPGIPVQTEVVIEPGTLPSPIDKESKDEHNSTNTSSQKQPEAIEKPDDMDKTTEPLDQVTTPKQVPCPLPEPPTKKIVLPEPESPILPRKFREETKVAPQPMPKFEENMAQKPKPKAEPIKKMVVPPPTAEDEPEPTVMPVKEQTNPKPKAEVKHNSPKVDHQTMPNAQHKDVQPKMEPKGQPKAQVHKKSTSVQPPHIPEVTQKPSKAPHSEVPATSSVPNGSAMPSATATSSAPRVASIPNTASAPRYSVTLNTSTMFVPRTAPAPHTARAPMTAPAPVIATAPKVVMSMLGWTLPKPAPIPKRAHSPATSWIVSSA